ncbi:STAS domain-containing protein [Streptomyces sp. BR1]|uniref:STAS domain-containing protein n=1 Tax=Streptomyces sp. BR1 TaxID=1592323 RepID=UPI00402B5002
MPLPQLNVYRHDTSRRSLITLAGEIDLTTVPQLRETLEQCLLDGIRVIDVDLTPLTFCDVSGLNAFLYEAQRAAALGGSLRLHYPPPPLARMVGLVGTGFLRLEPPFGHRPLAVTPASTPTGCRVTLRRLASVGSAVAGGTP